MDSAKTTQPLATCIYHVSAGCAYYYLTSIIVLMGGLFGAEVVRPPLAFDQPDDVLSRFSAGAGRSYAAVAMQGYSYERGAWSNVALFPVYPLLGRLVVEVTNWSIQAALLVIAHLCLAITFIVMSMYSRQRLHEADENADRFALLAFGLLPTTFFFRMAYSESAFLMSVSVFLLGLARGWRVWQLALIVGFATGVRPVGLALVAPLLLYLWHQRSSRRCSLIEALAVVPLSCWGILGYMVYLSGRFGHPLAFVEAHARWADRAPAPLHHRILELATAEPIWSVYLRSSPAYWGRLEGLANPLFSLQFVNPLYFVLAAALIAVGGWRRWLNSYEVLLGSALLFIPFVTQGYNAYMAGMGRYAAAAIPIYLVMGRALSRVPPPLAAILLAISAFFLGAYSALFTANYRLI